MTVDSRTLMLLLLGLALAPLAHAGPLFFYKFTPVADTQGGFPYEAFAPFPSVNSGGRVAFIATLTGGNQAVLSRRGTGGPITVQDLASGPYFSFGLTTGINSLETILFVGLKQGDDEVLTDLVRGQGNTATRLLTFPNDRVDSFCGSQINIQKTVVFTGDRRDGSRVILAVGAGDLTGPTRVIAEEGKDGFTSLGCAPSIGFDGTVAFTAIRNGRRAIFTRGPPPGNQLTQIIDDSGPFVSFTDVAFNQQGGVAFGARQAPSGARSIQRIRNGVLTKVGDTSQIGGALSINESGQVAFEVVNPIGGATAVFLGPNSLFGRIVGPGSVVLGRTVTSAHIERGSLNSVGQIAVHFAFSDGTQMIALGDPVTPDIFAEIGALQLATAEVANVSAGTPMPTFPINSMLTFDVAFLSAHGELSVKVNDAVLKSIPASQPGVRQRISLPVDLRTPGKYRSPTRVGELRFVLDGKPGASVQISNVTIPGLLADRMDPDSAPRWQVDVPRGGVAEFVSAARQRIRIQLTSAGAELVRAAVLSTQEIDATVDIEPLTLRLGGYAARTTRDKSGKQQPVCETRDANGDKLDDLVCEVEVKNLGKVRNGDLQLEAMTRYGWGLSGAASLQGK